MKLNIPLYISIPLVILGIFMSLALRQVPTPSMENSAKVSGELVFLEEHGGPGDVTLRLKDNDVTYYINRGTENGVDPNQRTRRTDHQSEGLTFPLN